MLAGLPLLWLQWQIASDMRGMMNLTVDPCDDFYEYACGNFAKRVPIPDDKSETNRFSQSDDQIKKELRRLLEADESPDEPESTLLAKRFYKSCVNEKQLEHLGLDPLKSLIRKFGGWPVVEGQKWNQSNYDWMRMNAKMTVSMASDQFVGFFADADFKNSSKRTLFIDQASLGLDKREYYLDKSLKQFLDSYFDFMVATAVQLGASKSAAKKELQELLDFETALAEANIRDEDRRDNNALYHPFSIKELKAKYPKINFDLWFKTVSEAGWRFDDDDVINLSGLPFMERLTGILANFSSRTLANYQIWTIAANFVPSLAPSLRENYRKFREALSGSSKFKARWDECVAETSQSFTLPVGAMYVRKYFSQETKKELDNMVKNIRETMKSTIEKIQWMDESTKDNAQKKLANMIQNMAFPTPDIYDEAWVMRDYRKVHINEDTFLENQVSLIYSKLDRMIREFRDPINKTEWIEPIAIVNAWYSPDKNRMTFPAGILRYSFYSPHAPNYYNYGHIGSVMGHEMTHGFDDQGRQYDANGNFELWWTNATLEEFTKGAKCFINQYANITEPKTGQHLNGENTQGENIADNGGVKLAFKAWQTEMQDPQVNADPRNRILPAFTNFTAEQMYFLSYGQNWCDNVRLESLKTQIVDDPHAPNSYRTMVPLRNNQDFAKAFNCPVGSKMNPIEKCQIW